MSFSQLIHYHSTPNKWIKKIFYSYGKVVTNHALLFTLLPPIMVAILGIGIIYKEDRLQIDPTYLFAPTTGSYLEERRRIQRVWPVDPDNFTPFSVFDDARTTQAILRIREGINRSNDMLTLQNINEAIAFNQYIVDHIVIEATLVNVTERFGFREICMKLKDTCSFENEYLGSIRTLIRFDAKSRLTYPATKIRKGHPSALVAAGLGGIEVGNHGVLKSARFILLTYFVRHDLVFEPITLKWEEAYAQYIEKYNQNKSNRLSVVYTTSSGIPEGLEANKDAMRPRVAITFFIIITFIIMCSFRLKYDEENRYPSIDTIRSRPLLAAVGLLTPTFAIVSGQGLLMFVGYPICGIAETIPFLVLSIGVDDMFILTTCWDDTRTAESVEARMASTMSEAAASITITSLTNIASFAVGMSTPIRAAQIFCAHMAVAIAMDYILQITFFAGFMAISGKWEAAGRSNICLFMKSDPTDVQTNQSVDVAHMLVDSFYSPLLTKLTARIVTLIVFAIYLGFGLWGILNLDEGQKTHRLIVPGHYSAKFTKSWSDHFEPQGIQVEIMVQNVPNLSNIHNRASMEQIVSSFENLTFTMDKQATQFWMRDYLESNMHPKNRIRDWTRLLHTWSQSKEIQKSYSQALKWENASSLELTNGCECERTGVVSAFRFKIALKNFGSMENQKLAVTLLRKIAKSYVKYNVTTYSGCYPYLDQFLIILPTTIRNIGLAILCVGIITFILIPNPVCVAWIMFTILSIDIGVVGYMTWWGVSLDGLSMITIVMSIGFSVDFSAHIAYGFTTAEGSSQERLAQAMKHMGLPVLQGGLSTLIGISVLSTLDSLMVQTFFKTVFLVILLGMIHACIFLPVMLVTSYDCINYCRLKVAGPTVTGQLSNACEYHPARQIE